jgi:benzoyl-CoA reductase/2-hydroxyglutaryl-CoA dehydratase subunit BcrC/BadD/HgdB
MDMVPVCPEAVSAILASSLLGPYVLNIAEENHYSRDVCSFTRCAVGAAIDNFLPTPDFLASMSYYCDNTNKLFSILGKMYGKDCFLLDIPYDYKSENSLDYLTAQLKAMTSLIEEGSGNKLDPEKLARTINLTNEAREYFIKVNELRTSVPAPISGGEAIDFAALLAFTWGSEEMVDLCKTLYEEVKEKVETNADAPKTYDRPRILWRHLRPYYDNSLIDFIEKDMNCDIVFEEINYIHWGEMDPDDPFRSLARKLILNSPVGPIEHWIEDSFGLLEKYRVNAVISFNHWGCRQLSSTNQIFKDELKKRGIPALELGGDCIDNRNYSFQQMKTRIQAFIEMIEDNM